MPKAWEAQFPQLQGRYTKSSEVTKTYNCAAFAVGDDQNWWDPLPPKTYYWPIQLPPNISEAYAVASYIRAFETRGFRTCSDGSLEAGFEKIAIYGNRWGYFEHAARQLPDGRWISKIAEDEDITHDTVDLLLGEQPGDISYMARPKVNDDNAPPDDRERKEEA